MRQRAYLGWAAWATTLAVLAITMNAGGCAASEEVEPEDDGRATTTTTATTTSGGGGATGSGGSGAGGMDFPCGENCSLIDTPPCLQSVCNMGEYPGAVGSCTVVPEDAGTACDDGQFCTTADACNGMGTCEGGPPNDCGMGAGPCTEVTCDEASNSCEATALPLGTACTDPNDLCLIAGSCDANGACNATTTKDCFFEPVPNECFVSQCNPMNGMCEPVAGNEGQACTNNMDLCSVGNTCTMGVCGGGTPKDCSALTQGCNLGQCNMANGQCEAVAVPNGGMCDDLDICTTGETCQNGMCTGGTPTGNCQTFTYTGNVQTFTVPTGVTMINVAAWGAQGGGIGTNQNLGGLGGTTTGSVPVTPGQTVYVYVGGQGTAGSGQACNIAGGFNGGGPTGNTCCSNAGSGAGSGGGASDIRIGGQTLNDRVIVAAGGGGGGSNQSGADGGGLMGANGGTYQSVQSTGGTQTMGGNVGGHFTSHTCSMGTNGSFGQGGEGDGNDGGGGGGGWYGGGGGPNNGGGSGGSSYYAPTVINGATSSGVQAGNGEIIISW